MFSLYRGEPACGRDWSPPLSLSLSLLSTLSSSMRLLSTRTLNTSRALGHDVMAFRRFATRSRAVVRALVVRGIFIPSRSVSLAREMRRRYGRSSRVAANKLAEAISFFFFYKNSSTTVFALLRSLTKETRARDVVTGGN